MTQIVPDAHLPAPLRAAGGFHIRSRTSSSNVFPAGMPPPFIAAKQPSASPSAYTSMMHPFKPAQRTLSNATTSTSTTGTGGVGYPAVRTNSNASENLRRSGSSRSSNSPGGYVALMRKQKATVWCDRAQHEDPRIVAQQKAAKMRAAMEVVGGAARVANAGTTGSSSMLSRSKIRHHAKPTSLGYTPASLVGGVGGVPMRLSASEVEDGAGKTSEADTHHLPRTTGAHRRSGSGVNSLGTPRPVPSNLRNSQNAESRLSQADTLQTTASDTSDGAMGVAVQTNGARPSLTHTTEQSGSGYSGRSTSSGEREANFGSAGNMPVHYGRPPPQREISVKNPDELRRRGSVDDRTMTLNTVRLFVANPDVSD